MAAAASRCTPCPRPPCAKTNDAARTMEGTAMKRLFDKTLIPLVAALVLSGCASTPAFAPTTTPEAPATFKESGDRWVNLAPAEAQPRGEWWRAFGDPVLDDLLAPAEAREQVVRTH